MRAPRELAVAECGGVARSGKGTIVAHYATHRAGVATEETGADYRLTTKDLLVKGKLEPGMPPEVVQKQVAAVGAKAIEEVVANRKELVAQYGHDSLYAPDVTDVVGDVSPITIVRKAVKAGFIKRVKAVRDSGKYQALLVDGRNLAPVVAQVPGTKLILSTFISCYPVEAALRDCARRKIDVKTEAGQAAFQETLRLIQKRNARDASRTNDPVRPAENAIDYWNDQTSLEETLHSIATDRGVADHWDLLALFSDGREFTDITRRGVGRRAHQTGRQVHLDTTCFRSYDDPKGDMLIATTAILDEAFSASGLHLAAR